MSDGLMLLLLRLVHVTGGIYWGGAMFFTVLFLGPSLRDAGPDGARVMQGMQTRGFMTWTPVVALLVILSGIELMRRISGNFHPAWFGTSRGVMYSVGMVATVLAFAIGVFVMRPVMAQAARRAADGDVTAANALRSRAALLQWVTASLLLVAVGTMAVGRYV